MDLVVGRQKYFEYKPYTELATLLASLRALGFMHHSHHWQTKEYDKHLLFQRLYEDIQDEVDILGEKLVGLGDISLTNYFSQLKQMKEFLSELTDQTPIVETSLKAEVAFLALGKTTLHSLKEKGLLTVGLEQAIGNILDKHEEHTYLLKLSSSNGGSSLKPVI